MTDPTHSITRNAPAKLNLTLRVVRRRDDGFHEIETLMVPVPGLHDVLTLAPAGEFEFTCDDASLPTDRDNLVVRAVMAFAERASVGTAVRVHLQKRIPSGAGLGGGSSDAAAALLALQELHDDPLADEVVSELAADLGSDVPFFLQRSPARCTGRGERIEVLRDRKLVELPVVLLKPRFPVATVDAYRRALDPSLPRVPGVPFGPQRISGLDLFNDLEQPVFAKHRFLGELKLWLLERPDVASAMMSGSGATVFAILNDAANASEITRAARHELDETLWSWHGEIAVPVDEPLSRVAGNGRETA